VRPAHFNQCRFDASPRLSLLGVALRFEGGGLLRSLSDGPETLCVEQLTRVILNIDGLHGLPRLFWGACLFTFSCFRSELACLQKSSLDIVFGDDRWARRGDDSMMDNLAEKTCTPCRGGIPPLTQEDAERLHVQVPDWELRDDAHRIERSFQFRNFREALSFVQRIGELAETQGHHPDVSFGWGYATVSLRTKKIKGLHENDFIMAGRIDRIFKANSSD